MTDDLLKTRKLETLQYKVIQTVHSYRQEIFMECISLGIDIKHKQERDIPCEQEIEIYNALNEILNEIDKDGERIKQVKIMAD